MPAPRNANTGGWFLLVLGGWTAYGVLVLVSPETLHDYWVWVGDQDLWLKVILWTVTLPWMVGLAIRESSWEPWVRTTAVWLVAIGWISLAMPKTGPTTRKRSAQGGAT
jgi:hypothetical protein